MVFTNLPRDLESEILSRVPARSLQKLKPTCKRWYTLFKDPEFLKKHVGRAEREVLSLIGFRVYSVSVNLSGIHSSVDPPIEMTGMFNSLKDSANVKILEICECNGLLLCTTNDSRLVVWNPYTGETRWIPYKSSTRFAMYHKFVLGYDNSKSCYGYKILRCYHFYIDFGFEYEIYDFNSDSWRRFYDNSPNCSFISKGVTLKGNIYWFASDTKGRQFILRFDFTTEKFGRLSLPYQSGGYVDDVVETGVLSAVREEKLALLYERFDELTDTSVMKIWVTNTKIDEAKDLSWSDFLVVDSCKFMVPRMTNVMSFLVDEEKKMVVFCDTDSDQNMTRFYIVGEDIHKEVYNAITEGSFSYWPRLVSYAPSLVQIQQGKVNPGGKRKR
ncbi:unnamed protein product [Arabidopsis lyrata]|uniref:F-box family protein n=1 Tax=Arabidopsis lyrata subsp. lyrata TaxID=81972 RepID=D7L798_ARALL|nr:putative F-box/kelch-repeat protein At3g17570 [Arabidopsis lyrata subsp. lyrata]EFH59326.1 F-box family protein [Arabidopsis lyrata subsp. lyrata]CAH8260845.1 unnamed protein product [Arabidopsis lyrata]|eukprot:XP_002883067.1 putative F-box/kelch-repeat protein At3g17570 [Arabidopsis lyrata subsp. lyrata]